MLEKGQDEREIKDEGEWEDEGQREDNGEKEKIIARHEEKEGRGLW